MYSFMYAFLQNFQASFKASSTWEEQQKMDALRKVYHRAIQIPLDNVETYFDIVNLDRYDCVFGKPFMNEHGIVLDFKRRELTIGGQRIRAFTHEEDAVFRASRCRAQSSECKDASS